MFSLGKGSSNFQSQTSPKKLEGLPIKNCRYHRVISHPIEKCIMLKERIMQLAKDEKIILDLDDTVKADRISTQWECSSSSSQQEHA